MDTASSLKISGRLPGDGRAGKGKVKCIMELRGACSFCLMWRRLQFCFILIEKTVVLHRNCTLYLHTYFSEGRLLCNFSCFCHLLFGVDAKSRNILKHN